MYTLLTILILIAAVLLIGVVLIQKSKGGGLSSAFAGYNQIGGVRKTTDFVEKATWTLAIVICLLSILTAFVAPRDLVQSRTSRLAAAQQEQEQSATPFSTQIPVENLPEAPEAPEAE